MQKRKILERGEKKDTSYSREQKGDLLQNFCQKQYKPEDKGITFNVLKLKKKFLS